MYLKDFCLCLIVQNCDTWIPSVRSKAGKANGAFLDYHKGRQRLLMDVMLSNQQDGVAQHSVNVKCCDAAYAKR